MIISLEGYRDDNGRLEVEVKLDGSGDVLCTFIVEEHEFNPGCLSFTQMPMGTRPSWAGWHDRPRQTPYNKEKRGA